MIPSSKQSANELNFDPHALAREELLYIYRGRNNALRLTAVNGAAAAGLLAWGWGAVAAVAWYGLLLAAQGWHWRMGRAYRETDIAAQLAAIRNHIAAAGLAGAGWGCAAFALPGMNPAGQAVLVVLLVLAVVTTLPRLVVFLPMFYAYTAGALAPMLLVLPFLPASARALALLVLAVAAVTLWLSAREVRALLVQILQKQITFEQDSWEDRLTGLGNRRHFDEKLDAGWRQAARQAVPLSLIMLDVDLFKKFNDAYGHPAGDGCLRQVAGALAGCVKRAGDSVARYGGEEFAVIMVHMSMADARNMGERMRQAVMSIGLEHEQSPHGVVTVSIGGATIIPSTTSSPQELVRQADAALYRAKEMGRNRVEWNMAV